MRERCEREPHLLGHGSGFVFYALMDAVVDRYFPIMDRLESELEGIEEQIFAKLDELLAQELAKGGRRRAGSLLDPWLPHRVGETAVVLSGTAPELPVGEFSKAQRRRLVQTAKRLDIPVAGTMGFRKAEVTAGGVSLDEVDSRTMQSKIVPNLFFAGELLDLNGPEGGYNFQAAFSTGWLAGENV